MEIHNKVAVITGGLGGIGFATVKTFLKNGIGYVAIFDLPKIDSEQVVQCFQVLKKEFDENKFGYFACDVTNAQEFEASFKKLVEIKNDVNIFINNAGINSDINFESCIDVNVKAVIRGSVMALEHMRKDKGGKGGAIVNIGSIAGLRNLPNCPIYNVTKHAVITFVRSMKAFNKTLGVRILCICPDMTDTALIDAEQIKSKLFDFVDHERVASYCRTAYLQKPETVAAAIVKIIVKGDDGAVWIIDNDNEPDGIGEINEATQLRYKLT